MRARPVPPPLHIGAAPERFRGEATLLDGRTAQVHAAAIAIDEDPPGPVLRIEAPGQAALAWPLVDLRRIPDQADATGLIVTAGADNPARLVVRGAEEARILRARCPELHRPPPVTGTSRLLMWAAASAASVAVILWVLLPAVADRLARVLPPAAEQVLGDRTLEQVRLALRRSRYLPVSLCEKPQGRAALDAMADRLGGGRDLPYPVRVLVLDLEMVNAVALPGGLVVLFDGLLQEADTPEQVAAVLAHEIGHVAARDPTRIALRTAGSVGVLGLLLGDFAGGAVVLFLTERLLRADYSRAAEAEADAYAHDLLARADISPAALAQMFRKLADEDDAGPGIASHFASHPALEDRIAAALAAGERLGEPAWPALDVASWEHLRAICR